MSERSTTSTNPDDDDEVDDVYDPDDAPILTDEMAARAQIAIGDRIIREADPPLGTRRGRPPKPDDERKEQVSIRLSPDVMNWLRASGPGWQTRIEDLLRREMGIAAE
ncbi:MAG: BrnA antitoxin family protein [Allosphingosinicella sp.]